ncbi:MAG: GSCFA domain-containing protein [Bacteroidales bacterium]|nr:GSCFA domain-containing protein [Bacteroidales bacterium]
MLFRTEIKSKPSAFQIDYQSKILMIGSCFSDNIGNKLKSSNFDVLSNPFGVLYNPISVATALRNILNNKQYNKSDLFVDQGLHHSFDHHSMFSDLDETVTLYRIKEASSTASNHLKETQFLFLTFGTAFVYELKETRQIVSNCHKLPAKLFDHYLLKPEAIVEIYSSLINNLNQFLPNLQIILTVSPVRHWKDGAHENQISKSILHYSIHQLEQIFENVSYFPSYELLMDDLRDYRFYEQDLIHPNNLAVDYIYEHFQSTYFNASTLKLEQDILKIKKALQHRPFNPESESHLKFLKQVDLQIQTLKNRFPNIHFDF